MQNSWNHACPEALIEDEIYGALALEIFEFLRFTMKMQIIWNHTKIHGKLVDYNFMDYLHILHK